MCRHLRPFARRRAAGDARNRSIAKIPSAGIRRIETSVLQEDADLLMYYDNAMMRMGAE